MSQGTAIHVFHREAAEQREFAAQLYRAALNTTKTATTPAAIGTRNEHGNILIALTPLQREAHNKSSQKGLSEQMSTRKGKGSSDQNHQGAAEMHNGAEHAHLVAAEAHEKQNHQTGHERPRQEPEHSQNAAHEHAGLSHQALLTEAVRARTRMSQSLPMGYGKPEDVRMDRRTKTGSTPHNSCSIRERVFGSSGELAVKGSGAWPAGNES